MAFTFTPAQMPGLSPAYALNPNQVFADWPIAVGAMGFPPGWSAWMSTAAPAKVLEASGAISAAIMGSAAVDGGMQATMPSFPGAGWYVLEAKIYLASGALTAAGVYIDFFTDATFVTQTTDSGAIDFTTVADVNGNVHGAGTAGQTYIFRVLFQVKLATSVASVIYAFSHWSGFGHSEAAANQIDWEQCSVRPATLAEIAAGNAQYGLPVFPILPGQATSLSKAPKWSTKVKRAASGRERRTALWPYPLWQFELSYEVIRQRPTNDELAALWRFFNAVQGQCQPWLFLDPTDYQQASPVQFGVGDGSTVTFQTARAMTPSQTEPVYAPFGMTVFINGAPTTAYTTLANGLVVFTSPPASGAMLTWTGDYYFGCRFLEDDLTFEQLVSQLWSGKSVKFTSLRA